MESKTKTSIVGSISNPISLFITAFAGLSLPESMQAPSPLVPALKSNWLMMHVTVMMLSYASLIVGSLLGMFFLVLSTGNKRGKFSLKGNSYGQSFSGATLETAFYETDTLENYTNLVVESSPKLTQTGNRKRLSLL